MIKQFIFRAVTFVCLIFPGAVGVALLAAH